MILVHGTFGDMTVSWNSLAPALQSRGFCVWALDYGRRGTGPIDGSADELVAFIDQVRAQTGAAKVSLVGHSQGGMLSRYVAVRRGRLDVVDDIVGLAPSSHGTTTPLAGPAGTFGCTACAEQVGGLGVHAQGQRAAAGGARARLVHGRHDHPRRGRHAAMSPRRSPATARPT